MQPRHLYAAGLLFLAAVFGVFAVAATWAFAFAAAGCFALGLAIERRWIGVHDALISWDRFVDLVPFEIRRKEHAPRPESPLGILDYEREGMRAAERVTRTLVAMTTDQKQLGALFTNYTPRFADLATASTDRKIELSREFARKLNDYARRFESKESALRLDGEAMATNYLHRIEGAPAGPELTELRATIDTMRNVTSDTRAVTSTWREANVTLRAQNLQQSVNEALDRLILAATRITSDFDRTFRFATDALALIDAKTAAAEASARAAADLAPQSSTGPTAE